MSISPDRRWADDARLLIATLLALVAWDLIGLDLPLTRLFGTAQGFVWRDHWLTAGLLHDGMRNGAWALFAALTVSVWWPLPLLGRLSRRERLWWLGTTLLCVAMIPLLKRQSLTSCPWSLAEFGGAAHYVSHWLPGVRDGGPGGCFPSGHASTAFGFFAGWFALRRAAPRAARVWLLLTFGIGLVFGWVQLMRGAHYASHSLWTGWICWTISAASFHLSSAWHRPGKAMPDANTPQSPAIPLPPAFPQPQKGDLVVK